eukprot:3035600-Pleurochrysis_carterae.AAC.3
MQPPAGPPPISHGLQLCARRFIRCPSSRGEQFVQPSLRCQRRNSRADASLGAERRRRGADALWLLRLVDQGVRACESAHTDRSRISCSRRARQRAKREKRERKEVQPSPRQTGLAAEIPRSVDILHFMRADTDPRSSSVSH